MGTHRWLVGFLLLGSSTLVTAQTPTPTRVDSNIAFNSFAQGNCPAPGQTPGTTGCGGCYAAPLIQDTFHLSDLPTVDPEWSAIGTMIPGADSSTPPASNPVLITGTVGLSKSPGDDFPGSHISPDYNTELIPDSNGFLGTGNDNDRVEFEWEGNKFPLYAWPDDGDRMTVLGRWIFDCGHPDPDLGHCSTTTTKTCLRSADCPTGETCVGHCSSATTTNCTMHSDCPLGETCVGYAGGCATNGVRCVLDGDCVGACTGGHCSNNPALPCGTSADCNFGSCTNPKPEFNVQSELHPPQAVAVIRNKSLTASHKGRTAPAIPATRADVYVSNDGGGAGDRCVVNRLTSATDVLFTKSCFVNRCSATSDRSCRVDSDCAKGETCITLDPTNRLANLNAQNFEFDMPLPPRPSSSATLKVLTLRHPQKGGLMPKAILQPTLAPTPNLHVIIPMATPIGKKNPNLFAASISAGWKEDTSSLTHVQVKLTGITINNPLKESVPALPTVCTNNVDPNGGLTTIKCSSNADCPAGVCGDGVTPCHTDADCPKTDACGRTLSGVAPSQCAGGIVPGWDIWAEVNGDWTRFAKLASIGAQAPFSQPPYLIPPTPALITETGKGYKFDEFVPSGGSIHIRASGHSFNCLTTLFGADLKTPLHTLGVGSGAACLNAGTKSPGEVDIQHTDLTFAPANLPPGVACGPGLKAGTFNCQVTSQGGEGGTCSVTTAKLCVTDSDCPGTCSATGGPCTADADCRHCSGSPSTFCAGDRDCPTGTCSNDASRACHVASDCKPPPPKGTVTCNAAQNCVAGSETCQNPETCMGKCSVESTNQGATCHSDGDCLGGSDAKCQFGGFTLQYTIGVIP